MLLTRSVFAISAVLAAALPPASVSAQDYPTKAITFIVPFAPGGSSDFIARLVGQKLSENFKQPVVVENKPGGAGVIAMQAVARAAPDGHTIILAHIGTMAVNPAMFEKLAYDPVKEFAPVSLLAVVPSVIAAHPSLPAKTIQELIALIKAKPGTINYGTAGNGSAGHLAMEYFKQSVGLSIDSMTHVPYRGTGPMLTDLLAGQTQLTFTGATPVMPHVKSGKLNMIGIGGVKRLAAMPDVGTVSEAGIAGFETSQWYGVLAPAATPPAVIEKLQKALSGVLANPELITRLQSDGADAVGSTPDEFKTFIAKEAERWGRVVKTAGIKPD
jgi:tripartite-type tricarboxylate transporter receptor subunit TctC